MPCYASGEFRSSVTNAGDLAPSWMRDRLVIKSPDDLTSDNVGASGIAPDGADGFLDADTFEVDHVNQHVSFKMVLVPYPS